MKAATVQKVLDEGRKAYLGKSVLWSVALKNANAMLVGTDLDIDWAEEVPFLVIMGNHAQDGANMWHQVECSDILFITYRLAPSQPSVRAFTPPGESIDFG